MYRYLLVLVGAAIPLVHAARPPTLRHGHSSLAAVQTVSGVANHASVLPLSVEMPSTVHFSSIGRTPEPIEQCGCEREEEEEDAVCSCSRAIKVLKCITKACSSGGCNCNNGTLVDACEDLADKCDNLEFSCSARKATCDSHEELEGLPIKKKTKNATKEKTKNATKENETAKKAEDMKSDDNATLQKKAVSYDEVYEELASLKEDKCKLQFLRNDGHNVDKKLRKVMKEIDQKMEELNKAGQKLPEMHCYKHFEEWHEPSSNHSATKSHAHRAPLAATACAALVAAASFAVTWS